MSEQLPEVAELALIREALEAIKAILGGDRSGVDHFERVVWSAGGFGDYNHRGTFEGVFILNEGDADALVSFTPGGGAPSRGGTLTLEGRSWATIPVRGSFVSIGGTAAGVAVVVPLDTAVPPAAGNLGGGVGASAAVPQFVELVGPTGTPVVVSSSADNFAGQAGPIVQALNYGASDPLNNSWERLRVPKTFRTVLTAAAGSTALWTPAAGRRFRLMRYLIEVLANSVQAVAGTLTIDLLDGAGGIAQTHSVFVPAAAGPTGPGLLQTPWIDLGNGVLSGANNNVLNVNLSAALTAGGVRVLACGLEE